MPRVRDLVDYSSEESVLKKKPRETLIEVPYTDSVQTITIHLQPAGFVQITRVYDDQGKAINWKLVTNLNTVITRENAVVSKK